MDRLEAITVTGYRAFAEPARLELRPLTLLYGRNNAGKSTLARLLGILGDSVAESASAPLDLQGPAARNASFRAVPWDQGLRTFTLELSFSGGLRGTWVLGWDDDTKRTVVRSIAVQGGTGTPDARFARIPGTIDTYEEQAPQTAAHGLDWEDVGSRVTLAFTGLLPDDRAGLAPGLRSIRDALRDLRGRVQWVGPTRATPPRIVVPQGAVPRRMASDGGDALPIMVSSDPVLAEVAAWYAAHVERRLHVEEVTANAYRVLLDQNDTARKIDLLDTGEGMLQVLPVLVALALRSRDDGDGLRVIVIEEPASQLHPDAQRGLVDHLCAIAGDASPPSVVVETHARTVMLAVQVAIARRELDPGRVAAYWVEQEGDGRSFARRVEFDAGGRPTGEWPQDAFGDERELLRELAREQLKGAGGTVRPR